MSDRKILEKSTPDVNVFANMDMKRDMSPESEAAAGVFREDPVASAIPEPLQKRILIEPSAGGKSPRRRYFKFQGPYYVGEVTGAGGHTRQKHVPFDEMRRQEQSFYRRRLENNFPQPSTSKAVEDAEKQRKEIEALAKRVANVQCGDSSDEKKE